MTKYVKDINNELVEAVASEFPGVPNPLTNDKVLRKNGYLPRIGEPEPRDGYTTTPATWHKVEQSITKIEPRREDPVTGEPFMEDIMEWDEEQQKMVKVGERQITKDVPVVFDTSYWQIDSWNYTPIPAPEPPPLLRQFSKGDLLEALMALNLYDAAKAIYAADLDLQIAWAGFANIDMDYSACQSIMEQYSEFFTPENVEAIQRFITFGELPNAQQ